MRVAKLVLHYSKIGDTEHLTQNVLDAIPDAIVIDGGSEKPFEGDKVIRLPENRLFTGNWRAALEKVWNDYDAFLLMNNDIIIDETNINRVIQRMIDIPRIGAISGAVNSPHKHMHNHYKDYRVVPFVELVAPLIRKDAIIAAGGLDRCFNADMFPRGWGIDYHLGYILRRAGYSNIVDDTAEFIHLEHQTINNMPDWMSKAAHEMNEGLVKLYGEHWSRILNDSMINLAMVICNEAHRLPDMIEHTKRLVDEITIVVQESKDNSLAVARRLADKVIEAPCIGYCERHRHIATNQSDSWWQLVLDPDEFITIDFQRELRERIHTHYGGYRLARRLFIDGQFRFEGDSHYRLFQRNAVNFLDELHTEPQPTKEVGTLPSISIDHIKSLSEQLRDEMRYERLLHESQDNLKSAKLALNIHLNGYRKEYGIDPDLLE